MGLEVVIISHKRAGRVTTHKHIAGCLLCVPESQVGAYAEHHDKASIVSHPDSVYGCGWKRQWTYEKFGDLMMMDDDSIGMFRVWRSTGSLRKAVVDPETAREVCVRTFETASQFGAYLFGFGSHANVLTYKPNRPFRFGGYTPSGALGMRAGSKLFWPRDQRLCTDYWICCLNAHFHRHSFYDHRFAFGFQQTYTGQGGLAEFRYPTAELEGTQMLKRAFGPVIVEKRRSSATPRQKNEHGRSIQMPYPV